MYLIQCRENPVITEELDNLDEEDKIGHLDEEDKEDNRNPEPFEQTEVVDDYLMDTLYNKKRVPYIEKNNGSIVLTQQGDYKRAIEHYNKALFSIRLLIEDRNLNIGEDYVQKVIKEVEIPTSSNLTLCYLKEGDYQSVIKYANKLLSTEEDNVKILYRRGMAYTHLNEFEKAKEDLMRANKLEPNNKTVLEGLKIFKQKKYDYKYKTQKICKKIFDKETPTLYPEEGKEERKQPKAPRVENTQLEKGSVPYYLGKVLELGFAIPLVMYKGLLQKPTESLLGVGCKIISIPDHLPIVGGLWKRTRSGAAGILRSQFAKVLDRAEAQQEEPVKNTQVNDDVIKEEPEEENKEDDKKNQ